MRAPVHHIPSRNVRNKKTKSPGYVPGGHWVICDRCGCAVREYESRVTWEGYVVCLDDWEPRHPQDFVRSKNDRISPEGNVRPDYSSRNAGNVCTTNICVSGDMVSGCAISGNETNTITFSTTL